MEKMCLQCVTGGCLNYLNGSLNIKNAFFHYVRRIE